MFISNSVLPTTSNDLSTEDYEESPEHRVLEERLCKTLYYGRPPGSERPSLPLSELAVEYFRDSAPRPLGQVDIQFAANVGRKAYLSPCSLMVGMMYIRRLRHRNPEYLQRIPSSDLFLISMMVASKFMYDEGTDDEVYNDEWAEAAGMDLEELNELERDFLNETEWNLYIGEKDFDEFLKIVEMMIAWRKGSQRDFFTYTDLAVLTMNAKLVASLLEVIKELTKVIVVCCLAYTAGVAVLASSPAALSQSSHLMKNIVNEFTHCHCGPCLPQDPSTCRNTTAPEGLAQCCCHELKTPRYNLALQIGFHTDSAPVR